MKYRTNWKQTTLLLVCGLAANTNAATITGTVKADSQPVAGALVTLWNEARNRKETVYTNSMGDYSLETAFSGDLILRGRATNLKDTNINIQLPADAIEIIDLQLGQLATPEEVSNALTASAHAAILPFPDEETKTTFISQCTYCHQQGNSLTRVPRKEEAWSDAIWRMEGYGSYITYGEHKRIAQTLHKGFDGKPVEAVQNPIYTPELAQAKVEEWHAAGPMSFLHDTFIGADDKLYGIDEGSDKIYILDRETNQIEEYDMPVTDEVVGGNFSGMQLPIGIFTGKHGPHSAAQIADGRIYITGALSSNLIMFNPADKSWKLYPIPQGFLWSKGLYSHTIRTDSDDNLWFTVLVSNTVMRFNPHTETFTEITLPHNGALRWFTDTFIGVVLKIGSFFPQENTPLALSHHKWMNGGRQVFNWPYGIDVNPINGDIWYGKLLADKIGRIDPVTLEVTEYDVPHVGPRRLRFGPDGILWIPSFDEGKLMRFDPETAEFESIDLPLMGKNEYETPYALNVHHETGDVWIAANNSDRVLRYIPNEKRFIAYPMPSRVVWFRDLEFTKDGKMCTSNSNLPAYAHEDGVPAFFCIDPDYKQQTGSAHVGPNTTDKSVAVDENKKAYFGNVHIHTSWSFDGYTNGSLTNPNDAYRWAQGEAIPGGIIGPDLKIKTPLDFYAVSEHAEYMGVFVKMGDPDSPISKLPIAKEVTSSDKAVAFKAFAGILDDMNKGIPQKELTDTALATSLWEEVVQIANAHNKPGVFTTFPAFEWTSAPGNRNLHRVVVFKDSQNVPTLPFSTLDSDKPEDLWRYMDSARESGATLLAIPHNGNASDGLMFSNVDSNGNALDADYASARMRNEPLYEISQIKGTSEAHPMLSPNDEFAGFEQWEYTLSAITERTTQQHGSYLRQALMDGIELESTGNGNPFKYGIIGDSDTHNAAATIEEDNYTGKFGMENNPKHRLMGPLPIESNNKQVREFSSGGVAGVWAESNTRNAIYAAMMRKETFGTSGPRMKVRLFGSWNFDDTDMDSPSWVASAYHNGVPMGGDLNSAPAETAPVFLIAAVKEADGANLDRIQIIKGWVENGQSYEKIYNVALSGDRKLDTKGNAPAVGNTVDAKTASYENSIGAGELKTLWQDPDFNPNVHAFYYARVLEIPTPRWSTYDAKTLGMPPREDLPVTIQERAWTSPIWYTP